MNVSSYYENGITIFPSESDCLAGAPEPYGSLMHYLHVVTIPLYIMSFYVLVFKTPGSLKEYRKYLIWHTVGNLTAEFYISTLFLPVPYSPQMVSRAAGILKYFNINGTLQFWLLVATVIHTGLSIIELFKYRFNATDREASFTKKVLHRTIHVFHFLAIVILISTLCWVPFRFSKHQKMKQQLWEKSPNLSIEVLCYTATAPTKLDEPVLPTVMILIVIELLIAVTVIPYVTYSVLKKLAYSSKDMSKKTIELHKILLISLFIQALIHGALLGIPIAGFVLVIIFKSHNNNIAYTLYLLISYHGAISTVAMIGFTKPIRNGVIQTIGGCFPSLYQPNKNNTISTRRTTEFSSDSKKGIPTNRIITY